jgi:hypothetical protein
METRSQGISAVKRLLAGALPILLLMLVFGASAAVAWKLLTTRPLPRAAAKPPPPPEPGFVSVAGAAVDLEVFAPDGKHTRTGTVVDSAAAKIPESEGRVDCDNYGDPHATEANCTASVMIRHPAYGSYRIVATSADKRTEVLNIGFGGDRFARAGGFDVHVTVAPGRPATFTVSVAPEGASLRAGQALP